MNENTLHIPYLVKVGIYSPVFFCVNFVGYHMILHSFQRVAQINRQLIKFLTNNFYNECSVTCNKT